MSEQPNKNPYSAKNPEGAPHVRSSWKNVSVAEGGPVVQQTPATPAKPVEKPKKGEKTPVLCYYMAGLAFVLYAIFIKLNGFWGLVVDAIVAVAVFFILKLLLRKDPEKEARKKAEQEAKEAEKARLEEEKRLMNVNTGRPDVDEMIISGRKQIQEIHKLNDSIPDPILSEQMDRLESYASRIFEILEEQPGKAQRCKKFLNYYMPTTIKLLTTYQKWQDHQEIEGNVTNTLDQIVGIMETIVRAFGRQLDNMYEDEAMDVNAEITVLDAMLKAEGFKE